jgi:hypothetical protein
LSGETTVMSLSDNQVRLDILQILYNHTSDNPTSLGVDRAIIQATLQISQQQMDEAVSFLEANGLAILSRAGSAKWTFAKITSDGLDVVENKERYAEKYAFTQNTSTQIKENQQQVSKSQTKTAFQDLLTTTFRQASDQVLSSSASNNDKGKIEKQLKEFQKELLKGGKADLGSIRKKWEGLKKNASWLTPTLGATVLETIKLILDLE